MPLGRFIDLKNPIRSVKGLIFLFFSILVFKIFNRATWWCPFFSLSHPSPWGGDFVREPFPLSATEKFFQESSGHWLPFHFSGPSELKGKHTATLNSFLLCGRIHHPFIGGSIPAENDDVTQKSVSLLQVVALFFSGWPFFFFYKNSNDWLEKSSSKPAFCWPDGMHSAANSCDGAMTKLTAFP